MACSSQLFLLDYRLYAQQTTALANTAKYDSGQLRRGQVSSRRYDLNSEPLRSLPHPFIQTEQYESADGGTAREQRSKMYRV